MYLENDTIVVSASDVVAFLYCRHVSTLDIEVAQGIRKKPDRDDPMLTLLQTRGIEHEKRHLQHLADSSLDVVNLEGNNTTGTGHPKSIEQRAIDTITALKNGEDVLFQATFLDTHSGVKWRGHADFLIRVPKQTDLGDWGYEPQDTKLSTHASASAVLQLSFYADMIAKIQGATVDTIHIVLGSNELASFNLSEFSAYFRNIRNQFVEMIANNTPTYPQPNDHCRVCRWSPTCTSQWLNDDHLSLVANLSVSDTKRLNAHGINTLTELAHTPNDLTVPRMSETVLRRLQQQARLQKQAQPGMPPPWEFVTPFEEGRGLTALPEPDPGDVFYDIEGHPYAAPGGGLDYLHGIEYLDNNTNKFDGKWAHTEHDERRVFEELIDFITQRRQQHPGMHVYHYAHYEVTALRRMMMKYSTREVELDDLLRGDVFVDLYRVVNQGIRVGSYSYSIKKLEPLYMKARTDDIGDGGSSIVAYEQWLQTGDQTILDDILLYNHEDVISNRLLRNWLEKRRKEAIDQGLPPDRPVNDTPPGDRVPETLRALINKLNANRYSNTQP